MVRREKYYLASVVTIMCKLGTVDSWSWSNKFKHTFGLHTKWAFCVIYFQIQCCCFTTNKAKSTVRQIWESQDKWLYYLTKLKLCDHNLISLKADCSCFGLDIIKELWTWPLTRVTIQVEESVTQPKTFISHSPTYVGEDNPGSGSNTGMWPHTPSTCPLCLNE